MSGALICTGLAFGLSGCGDGSPAPRPETTLVEDDIFDAGRTQVISQGGSEFVTPETDPTALARIIDGLKLIDHQYPRGFQDADAVEISRTPVRIDAHVALSGESPELNNDLACDVVNVSTSGFDDVSKVYMGALALSEQQEDRILVSWPKQNGEAGKSAIVCFDDGAEPRDGVVLFLSDRPR